MNNFSNWLKYAVIVMIALSNSLAFSQVVLSANDQGNAYEQINSVLAPGYIAVEAPDQCESHPGFGPHIIEVWDADLKENVFEFYSHVSPDNDRCINFDRQRTEIKTFESSPDNLKGTTGETVTYKWKFKLPSGFQPSSSFTHIHQIKAVGGNEGDPIFTLTPRKGIVNKLELIHDNKNVLASVPLSYFENIWVEATEVLKVGISGTYSMTIKEVKTGKTILSFSSSNIMTIRPDNNFIRPKWGIYRSINKSKDLRNEAIRFADFYIKEG